MEKNTTVASVDRENRGVLLAASGASYDEIAEALGYASKSGAYAAVQRALKRRAQETATARDELIQVELETTRLIIRGLMPSVIKDGNSRSAEVIIKALERRANLMGWNAPVKADVRITDALQAEIDSLLEDMSGLDAVQAANLLARERG